MGKLPGLSVHENSHRLRPAYCTASHDHSPLAYFAATLIDMSICWALVTALQLCKVPFTIMGHRYCTRLPSKSHFPSPKAPLCLKAPSLLLERWYTDIMINLRSCATLAPVPLMCIC